MNSKGPDAHAQDDLNVHFVLARRHFLLDATHIFSLLLPRIRQGVLDAQAELYLPCSPKAFFFMNFIVQV